MLFDFFFALILYFLLLFFPLMFHLAFLMFPLQMLRNCQQVMPQWNACWRMERRRRQLRPSAKRRQQRGCWYDPPPPMTALANWQVHWYVFVCVCHCRRQRRSSLSWMRHGRRSWGRQNPFDWRGSHGQSTWHPTSSWTDLSLVKI